MFMKRTLVSKEKICWLWDKILKLKTPWGTLTAHKTILMWIRKHFRSTMTETIMSVWNGGIINWSSLRIWYRIRCIGWLKPIKSNWRHNGIAYNTNSHTITVDTGQHNRTILNYSLFGLNKFWVIRLGLTAYISQEELTYQQKFKRAEDQDSNLERLYQSCQEKQELFQSKDNLQPYLRYMILSFTLLR